MLKILKFIVLSVVIIASANLHAIEFDSNNISSKTLKFGDGRVPYFRNIAVSDLPDHPEIYNAVIVIHGTKRNAGTYYRSMRDAAEIAGQSSATVVIAPQFLTSDDVEDSYNGNEKLFHWSGSGWKIGYKAKNHNRYSSFQIIDLIIDKLENSPHLTNLVIIGHSAGGQFVNRYSALSQFDTSHFTNVKYITANPSSYLYFNNKRLINGSFKVPDTDAPYNEYRYGIERLNLSYVNKIYPFSEYTYANKKNILLLGTKDTKRSSSLDKSESADLQGRNRYQRGLNYEKHLDQHFASHNTIVVKVQNIGHSHSKMFKSSAGIDSIFD